MKTAAPDFTIMWDNAYCVHEFEGEFVPFRDMIAVCAQAGNPNRVLEFASTSKITLAGGGISVLAASEENIKYILKLMGNQIISYDKVNQLRHVRYLRDKAHTLESMKEHAALMAPKFRLWRSPSGTVPRVATSSASMPCLAPQSGPCSCARRQV